MSRINEADTLLIEKYLDKNLTEEEQSIFNQRLSDATFANEIRLYEKAVQAVYAFGDSRLKAVLQAEEAKLQADNASQGTPQYPLTVVRPNWQKWAMAASFLLIASVAAWLWLQKKEKVENPKQDIVELAEKAGVFAANFEPYKDYSITRSVTRSEKPKNTLEKAYYFYGSKRYAEAIATFEQISPLSSDAAFLQANAYLATHQIEKAIPILEKLSADATFKQQQAAQWYLALALSEKQPERAKALFQKIKDTPNHPYQTQAAAVK